MTLREQLFLSAHLDQMKPLEEMSDQELIDHVEALHLARLSLLRLACRVYREQARRITPRYRRDPDQLDHDEYVEEMSLGSARNYQP